MEHDASELARLKAERQRLLDERTPAAQSAEDERVESADQRESRAHTIAVINLKIAAL